MLFPSPQVFGQEKDSLTQNKGSSDSTLYQFLFETQPDSVIFYAEDTIWTEFSSPSHVSINPWLAASSDYGLFIGASIYFISKTDVGIIQGGYATGPSKYLIRVNELFKNVLHGRLSFDIKASSLDLINF